MITTFGCCFVYLDFVPLCSRLTRFCQITSYTQLATNVRRNIASPQFYHTPMYKPQLSTNIRIDITRQLSDTLSVDDKFDLLSVLSENEQLNLKARPPILTERGQDMGPCNRRN